MRETSITVFSCGLVSRSIKENIVRHLCWMPCSMVLLCMSDLMCMNGPPHQMLQRAVVAFIASCGTTLGAQDPARPAT